MAIYSQRNEYRGVNAHLHSHFQNEGGWKSFHHNHIGDLAKHIARLLPPGYTVDIEQSLQIEVDGYLERPEPDATIYQHAPRSPRTSRPHSDSASTSPSLTLSVAETVLLDDTRYATAVMIYRREGGVLGVPVTRIELLSPTNKRGKGRRIYAEKRELALRDGLPLVEIDYLHQTPPPIRGIPNYRRGDSDSYPYLIVISDPRPSLYAGITAIYGFNVDDGIPTLNIPLLEDEQFTLDFNAVYHQTFESLPAYSQRVDYERVPEKFDSYSAEDQGRIRERMRVVCESQGTQLS